MSHLSLSPEAPRGLEDILADAGASERMRSLLVMHRGKLLAEAYYHGAGPEMPANLKSVTKTLTSALVGVALRKGWIESVDDPLAKYLPERFGGDVPTVEAGITLRHLLTMSSGLAPIDYGAVQESDDWVGAVLGQPLDEDVRGKIFAYDTPVLQLLTAVLEKAGGMPVGELAQRELFGPMDAELVYWRPDAQGIALGGNDAYLRPRDLIELGELYRRGGELAGRRLLAPEFVQASTAVQIVPESPTANHDTLRVRGYGFLWWLLELGKDDVYAALGHGGQILLVSPSDELVVVMTSRWPGASSTEHYRHMTRILVDRILPAFRVSGRAGDERTEAAALTVRNAHAMAYDSQRGAVLLFGGADERRVLADLWAWDGEDWRRVAEDGPPPRTFPALVYDEAAKRLVLFGGNRVLFGTAEDTDTFLDDMWTWDGDAWHRIRTETPPARAEAGIAYDSDRQRIVLFGGYRNEGGERIRLGDTWEWDGESWKQVTSARTEGRFNSAMAYDVRRQAMIRFGGWTRAGRVGDTWTYDGVRWTRVARDGPAGRNHAAMAYDSRRGVIVLFGGHDGERVFGDTWEWGGSAWSKRAERAPRPRVDNGH